MATTSRYATAADTAASGSTKQDSTTTSSGTESGSTTTNGTKNINSSTTNMTPESLAALEALIGQLLTGGTAEQKQTADRKNQEITSLTQQRQGYSKEAAFADSQGLMAQQMRLALEKVLPSINTGALGAGSSQSSMRALLTQRAAENAAQNAQAAGLGAAVQYGGVANGISSTLSSLLTAQDPVMQALINAMAVAKGAVSNTTGTETTTGTSTSSGTKNSAVNQNFGGSNTGVAAPTSNTNSFGSYGPLATDQSIAIDNLKYTGTTQDTLSQLWGADNYVNNYTF